MHSPPQHSSPSAQARSQAPQWLMSLWMSLQTPPQQALPSPHKEPPLLLQRPVTWLHVPQQSMQLPTQHVLPPEQVDTHMPLAGSHVSQPVSQPRQTPSMPHVSQGPVHGRQAPVVWSHAWQFVQAF